MQTSTYKKSQLEVRIQSYVVKNPKVITFGFGKKRPIFLEKYLEANIGRADATRRLRLFSRFIVDIKQIIPAHIHKHSDTEFEIIFDGYVAHVREETHKKDKKLFLISTFEK